MLLSFEGIVPRIDPAAWIAPGAIVIGDVWIGPGSSVWFGCILRGDSNHIRIGARSNIQDGTILHVAALNYPCLMGDDVTVGHGAIIHACTLMDRSFVGMGATVLDGAVIEPGGMLAAGSVLTPGKRLPSRELWAGAPARKLRDRGEAEIAEADHIAVHYTELAARYRVGAHALPMSGT